MGVATAQAKKLFKNVPEKDILNFYKGEIPQYHRPVDFLHFRKDEVAIMNAIDKNYKYFQENLANFLANPLYENKFLVIYQETVKNAFDTFPEALKYAIANFPEGKFIIQKAIDESKRISVLKSAGQMPHLNHFNIDFKIHPSPPPETKVSTHQSSAQLNIEGLNLLVGVSTADLWK